MSNVLATPPAQADEAAAHFAARLRFETDVSDVHADLEGRVDGLVVVDSRGGAAWAHGHLPGAVHLPTAEIPARAADLVPAGAVVVTYCWGPGCNGATRAALALSLRGYAVREMLGGVEYWAREGFALRTPAGEVAREADPLVAPCGC